LREEISASLSGRRAVVTGAGNGLGLAIARRMVAGGASVLLVDVDQAVLTRVNDTDLPVGRAFAVVKDLAEQDAGPFVFDHVAKTLGTADILINNAAWSFHKQMLDVTIEEFDRVVHINQRAPYFLAQQFLRQFSRGAAVAKDPTIINIASVNALAGNVNLVAYAGTKGALAAMTRAMAVEMKDFNIRVNSISPGAVETSVTRHLISTGVIDPSKMVERYLVKRLSSCEEIAELVAYLSGSAATFVNGADWVIDGGYLAQ
jgi:NAD(P)-dependent dehydrogenase (short-subunit alcohol dehydrogenase family)